MGKSAIRVGGASGYWGDAMMATPQLLASGPLDYLVYDFLAEITMSILARARAKDPDAGYATDFVTGVLEPHLPAIAAKGVKVVANAGGVNPRACAAAVRQLIAAAGLDLRVGVVEGDDLLARAQTFADRGVGEMFSGESFPPVDRVVSANAYLGAFPIARALDAGADIVITGRVVDSAVTLGACIHEFGWGEADWDRLAAGTVAGHILECGPQATGGNFTDWRRVADSLADVGYPIAEIAADGSFEVIKPEGSGGLVSVGTISEQLVYEIGDPQAYAVPDVVCDLSEIEIEAVGDDRVRVTGAKGYPAPAELKVSATYADGFRTGFLWNFYGFEAEAKARSFADLAFARARNALESVGLPDFDETSVEILGTESQYGTARRAEGAREVVVKIAAKHASPKALGLLLKETSAAGLASPPGLSAFQGGRPKPSPVLRLFSFLTPKSDAAVRVSVDGEEVAFEWPTGATFREAQVLRAAAPPAPEFSGDRVRVPAIELAWGRSGDKGDKANVGIIARKAEFLPYLWHAMTEAAVAERFGHFLEGGVERFVMPGPRAINFLLHDVLGGGGVASLRSDPQGKGYAQLLLDLPVEIPSALYERIRATT